MTPPTFRIRWSHFVNTLNPSRRNLWICSALVSMACGFGPSMANAQVAHRGDPEAISGQPLPVAPCAVLPPVDVAPFLLEDARRRADEPVRFGIPIPANISPFNAGAWTRLPCGDFLWRLRIRSPGATSISLMFDSLTLGRESQLFVYTDDASVVLGPFSAHNNRADGIFATQPILGDTVTIELRQPEGGPEAFFRLSEIIHGYRNVYELAGSGDNVSNPCSMLVDVNCPPGAAFQDAKHAVGILLMEGYLCSGALLANTKHDALPLFLTANHCYVASSAPSAWVVLFNYEVFGCGGQSAPTTDSVQGAALLTRSPKSDFCLVLLDQIPESYKPYFAGWDRGSAAPTSSTGIHHPSGAPKKISQSYSACVPWSGNTPFAAGAKMWLIPQLDVGATMGGSSGSPLFDQSKRVVGQLYGYLGTNITCIQKNLIYGRLDVSWTEGAKYYLDPGGLAPMTLDGHFSVAPDLSAMALKGPTTGTKGQMIELTLQVEGANVSLSAPVSYRIRISKNKVISSDDPLIAEFPVPKFGMFETPGFTLPTWLPAGTYYWGVEVSSVSGETDTADNVLCGNAVKVKNPTVPDLVVTAVSGSGSIPVGGVWVVEAVTENVGAPFDGQYKWSVQLGDTVVATGKSKKLGKNWYVIHANVAPGQYLIRVVVEPVGKESNKGNNELDGPLLTVVAPAAAPDVIALSAEGPAFVTAGKKATVQIEFEAPNAVGPFEYEVRLSKNTVVDEGDSLVVKKSATISGVFKFKAKVPATFKKGWYYWSLIVKPAQGEVLLSNNSILGGPVFVEK